jgi:hypothetical protein
MKYTINIDHQNAKATALVSYLQTLEFIDFEKENLDFEVPEWQKDIVRDRIKSAPKESYISENEFEKRVGSAQ